MNVPSPDGGRTNYHDDFPTECARQFRPYRSLPSRDRIGQIFDDANINNYFGFGPHVNAAAPNRLVADTLSRYDTFLRQLVKIDRLDIVPARDVFRRQPSPERTVCIIRHDIDGDIVTAVEIARMEHAYGIKSTFNLLHTAPYYGRFGKRPSVLDRWPLRYLRDRVGDRRQTFFLRNEAMIEIYHFIQDLGHEIGLHVDGLHIFQTHRVDGAAAIREELDWLRRNGIRIVGMAPHNSAETYGAANSGLFVRRAPRHNIPAGPLSFERGGITIPLQVLDEADCGIDYEIDDLYQLQPTDFLSAIGHGDWWFNRVYPGSMETPTDELKGLFPSPRRHHLCQEHVLDHLVGPNRAGQVVLSVHPEHFGLRSHPLKGPLRIANAAIAASKFLTAIEREPKRPDLGEFDLEAAKVHLGQADGLIEFQTVVTRNEAGLHDFPIAEIKDADLKVVLIGGRQLGTETIAPAARVGGRLHRKMALEIGGSVRVATFAASNAEGGVTVAAELASNYIDVRDVDIIVLGIDLAAPSARAVRASDDDVPEGGGKAENGLQMLNEQSVSSRKYRENHHGADWRLLVEGHRRLIDHLKHSRADLILLIEETGATDNASAVPLAETAAARLAFEFDVKVVNPFAAFATHRSIASTLWRSNADWSILGHEIVADLICAVLLSKR